MIAGLSTAIAADNVGAAVVPGQSVVGLGLLPGAPELFIHDSGGNDVVQIAELQFPAAYGANKDGVRNIVNACLPGGVGFADLGAPGQNFTTKKHEYAFTFAEGVSVSTFSLQVLDWGDLLPFGANADQKYELTMTAFNANGDVVGSDTARFTSSGSNSDHRITNEYGDLDVSGDACTAALGQPGRRPFFVSGQGIVRVELSFRDRASMDPNIGLGDVQYFVTEGVGVASQGYWKHHAWPVQSIVLGNTSYSRDDALSFLSMPPAGDVTYVLVKQLIAAKLNIFAGSDASCISDVVADADTWLIANPIGSGVRANSRAWRSEGAELHQILGDYNEGRLCAPPID